MARTNRRQDQEWKVGDVFAIKLSNGAVGRGQIVGREPQVLNSVTIAVLNRVAEHESLVRVERVCREDVVSCVFATRELLDSGAWQVVGHAPPVVSGGDLPYEETRERGWVGAKVIGAGIVRRFVEAFFGLAAWDQMKDPNYFDNLLFGSTTRPPAVILRKRARSGGR